LVACCDAARLLLLLAGGVYLLRELVLGWLRQQLLQRVSRGCCSAGLHFEGTQLLK
jgi:hypothetical protein